MAEALVSVVLEQLASIARQQIEEQLTLVAGVDDDVRKLTSNFRSIRAVLEDAESRQFKDSAVRDWLDKLKEASYDIDDVLDEWNTSIGKLQVRNASKPMIKKVCSLIPCYSFCFRKVILPCAIARKIKRLNRTLDVISTEKNMFSFSLTERTIEIRPPMTTSFSDVSMVHGREADKEELLNKLLNETSQDPAISIVSIVGMGGIGKTTLARLVFNVDEVKTHFDKKIWVCVSEPFDEIRIAKAILESLGGDASKLGEVETILQHISQYIDRKKFFLVLDDVWTENPKDWEQLKGCLKCGSQGSRILITTRKQKVAKTIEATNMIMLGILSENESWSLFSQIAFQGEANETLEDIGRKIVSKCKELPLAIKTLGSLLRLKTNIGETNIGEWQRVLDSEMWEIEEVERGIFPPLLLSYYDLPSTLKKCFSYCAIFPKDYEIEKDELIKLWMAQSYLRDERNKDMELIGEEYFENLAMRSFFQDFKKNKYDGSIERCKMHDIVHDFAQFLTKNECFTVEIDNNSNDSQLKSSLKNVRHSMVILRGKLDSFPIRICNENKLRSLVVVESQDRSTQLTPSKLFDNLSLRALQFEVDIQEIPREIKKTIHLRYLDLSYNENLKELPKELCDLYNLQTLSMGGCYSLTKLPQEIGKLVNLRHLIINTDGVEYMPKGIEGLTCLRTLEDFVLSSSRHDGKACSIESLKNLTNLRCLGIRGLENVGDVGEVKGANLRNKTNLFSLNLNFGVDERNEMVLEAFEPPPNLVKLCLKNYGGKTIWPNWMVSLTQLRELRIDWCNKCEYLPPLGKLSSLESLFIEKRLTV